MNYWIGLLIAWCLFNSLANIVNTWFNRWAFKLIGNLAQNLMRHNSSHLSSLSR